MNFVMVIGHTMVMTGVSERECRWRLSGMLCRAISLRLEALFVCGDRIETVG